MSTKRISVRITARDEFSPALRRVLFEMRRAYWQAQRKRRALEWLRATCHMTRN